MRGLRLCGEGGQVTTKQQCAEMRKDLSGVYSRREKRLLTAIADVFGPGECACIKDMPGDNYTCTSHQLLHGIAWDAAKKECGDET